MAYVPGAEVDVFISYSHADNQDAWVTNFEQALKGRLHVLLGKEPEVWRDTRKLSGEHDFTEEIKLRLTRTAVLVVVVSPSYLASDFCRLERQHFSMPASELKVGTRLRIVRAVKLPDDTGLSLHRTIVKTELGFDFFNEKSDPAIEYVPASDNFQFEMNRLAWGVRNILRDLHNAKTAVYVAEPPPSETQSVWKRLRSELESRGFRVLPTFRPDEDCEPDLLLMAMKPAVTSVHLLGTTFSKSAALQLRLAKELGIPSVVWLPSGIQLEQPQREFVRSLNVSEMPDWQLAEHVSHRLKPKLAPAVRAAGGPARIYLICDRKNPADTDVALRLGAEIEQKEKMEVFLPDFDRDPGILDEQQQKKLADCDGVLLYWGQARKEWFDPNYGDLVRAERLRAQVPLRSRAIVLNQPDNPEKSWAFNELVLRLRPPELESLEPFLKPLRAAAGGN